jgi:ribosomal protein L37E
VNNLALDGVEANVYTNTTYDSTAVTNSCTIPAMTKLGPGNYEAQPTFVSLAGGDLRLRAGSACIDADNPAMLAEGAPCLREELWLRISSLRDAGQREQYDKVHVHRCALSGYEYADGIRTLVVQAAVQYKYGLFEKESGELLKGRPDRMVQERYEMGLCYVQDPDKLTDARKRELALSCPKCGAPLTNVGALKCSYCGTPIVPVNLRAWQFMWVRKG